MAELFELIDIAAMVESDLDTYKLTLVRKMATGALQAHTRLPLTYETTEEVPGAVLDVVVRLAVLLYDNPTRAVREAVEGHDVAYARHLLTSEDKRQLNRALGIPTARSVQLA